VQVLAAAELLDHVVAIRFEASGLATDGSGSFSEPNPGQMRNTDWSGPSQSNSANREESDCSIDQSTAGLD
jgi:hypothetical protein